MTNKSPESVLRLDVDWSFTPTSRQMSRMQTALDNLLYPRKRLANLNPKAVQAIGEPKLGPKPRYGILVAGTTYANLTNLIREQFAIVTTRNRIDAHVGLLATGDKLGRWLNRPAVAISMRPGDIAMLGIMESNSFTLLDTTSLRPDRQESASYKADLITESEILALYDTRVPIVQTPTTITR